MTNKVPGGVVRERGRRIREISSGLAGRFKAAQVGSVRPGLTIEDGSTVVTDNYLKLRVAVGRVRNESVRVRVLSSHDAEVVA